MSFFSVLLFNNILFSSLSLLNDIIGLGLWVYDFFVLFTSIFWDSPVQTKKEEPIDERKTNSEGADNSDCQNFRGYVSWGAMI